MKPLGERSAADHGYERTHCNGCGAPLIVRNEYQTGGRDALWREIDAVCADADCGNEKCGHRYLLQRPGRVIER